ncbi:MAG: OmpA family protein [Candidatus Schekmanbacteria bacterium]|nr:OmpA family protein [Candidatus Schekmanbacteria bacterium]
MRSNRNKRLIHVDEKSSFHDSSNGLRWLLTYADLITLLLIFFIIMYSISTTNANRFIKFVKVVKNGFSVFPQSDESIYYMKDFTNRTPSEGDDIANYLTEEINFMKLKENLTKNLKKEMQSGEITLTNESRGLNLKITDLILFNLGQSELTEPAKKVLSKIAESIGKVSNKIIVEGHTDNIPIHSDLFPSNWELSTSRATNVVRYFIESCHITPNRFSASGYAQYKPIVDNSTTLGNQKNRRVEIIILPSSDSA